MPNTLLEIHSGVLINVGVQIDSLGFYPETAFSVAVKICSDVSSVY